MPDWWICASLLVTLCIMFKDVNIKRFRLVLQIWDNLSTASSTSFDFFHVCVHILLQKHACRWQLLAYILAYSDKSDLQPILFFYIKVPQNSAGEDSCHLFAFPLAGLQLPFTDRAVAQPSVRATAPGSGVVLEHL